MGNQTTPNYYHQFGEMQEGEVEGEREWEERESERAANSKHSNVFNVKLVYQEVAITGRGPQ